MLIEMRRAHSWQVLRAEEVLAIARCGYGPNASEYLIEHSAIECFFIFEVVIEQSFVHSSGARDSVDTAPGPSCANSLTAAWSMAARLSAGRPRVPRRNLLAGILTNHLVK